MPTSFVHTIAALCVATALLGCQPSYPQCADDRDCQAPGRYAYCLNGHCAQCRDDNHCARLLDEHYVCESGACVTIAGFCREGVFPCPAGMVCRDARCGPECLTDAECHGHDQCARGRCVPLGCLDDYSCRQGQICQAGLCIWPARPKWFPQTIGFPAGQAEPDAEGKALVAEIAPLFLKYRSGQATGFVEIGCEAPESGARSPNDLATRRFERIRDLLNELKLPPEYVLQVTPDLLHGRRDFDVDDDNWCAVNFEWRQAPPVLFEPGESTLSAEAEAGLRRTASHQSTSRPMLAVACAAPDASPALNAARRAVVIDTLLDAGVPPHGIVVGGHADETRHDCTLDWLEAP